MNVDESTVCLFFLLPRTTVVSLTGEIKKKEKTLHEATVSRTGARIYDKRIYKPAETKGAFGQTGTKWSASENLVSESQDEEKETYDARPYLHYILRLLFVCLFVSPQQFKGLFSGGDIIHTRDFSWMSTKLSYGNDFLPNTHEM